MNELIDQPGEQRSSEKIDQQRLENYLLEHSVITSPIVRIQQFSGGASNLTYRISTRDEDLILRRPPFGKKAKSAHDMNREMTVLSALAPVLSCCPKPRHYCADEAVIGSTFYLMERIEGVIIRREMPASIDASPAFCTSMCQEFIENFVRLHEIKPTDIGLEGFGNPQGYIRRQVEGWIARLQAARTSETVDCTVLSQWLLDEMPADSEQSAIIHNDYKFDNVVWNVHKLLMGEAKLVGILDWEMATLGDPLMDLGSVLAYWVNLDDPKPLHKIRMMPTHLPGMFTRHQVGEYYLKRRGWPSMNLDYYYVFGLFRLAVIVQQIYYRYDLGQTDNPKFAPFGDMANLLIGAALRAAKPT